MKNKNKQLLLLAVVVGVIFIAVVAVDRVRQSDSYLARLRSSPDRNIGIYSATFDLLTPRNNQVIHGMFLPVKTFMGNVGSKRYPIKRTTKVYNEHGDIIKKDIDVYIAQYYIKAGTYDDYRSNQHLDLYDCDNRNRKRIYATGDNLGVEPIGCFDSVYDKTPNGRVKFMLVVEAECAERGCFDEAADENIHGTWVARDVVDIETPIVYNSDADREYYKEEAMHWSSDPTHFGIYSPRSGQEISGERVPLHITLPVGEGNYFLSPYHETTDEDGWLIPTPIDIYSWFIEINYPYYRIPVFDENGNSINQNVGYRYDAENPTGYFDSTYFDDIPLEIGLWIEYKYICGTDEGRKWGCNELEYIEIAGTRPIVDNVDLLQENVKERLENLPSVHGGEEINVDIDAPIQYGIEEEINTGIIDNEVDLIPPKDHPFRKKIDSD